MAMTDGRRAALDTAWQFVRFVATGGLAAGVNVVSRFALDVYLPFEASVLIAYLLGMVVAFVTFQRLIFGDPGAPIGRQIFRFCVVNAVGLSLTWIVSSALARLVFPAIGMTWRPFDVAHLCGVAVPAVTSYIGHRFYTFRA